MAVSFSNVDIQLTNSAVSILSAGAGTSLYITKATITNIDASAHTLTLYRVFSGASPASSNILIDPSGNPGTIGAGQTIALPLTGHNLVNGQSLYGLADANNVLNISISYIQQT